MENNQNEQQIQVRRLKLERRLKIFYAIFFGVFAGLILSVGLAVFVPQFYIDDIGKLVCAGKIEYITFKQNYYCLTAPNTSFAIGDLMFWYVFKRAIFPAILACILLAYGFVKVARYLWRHRAAAGF